MNELKRTRDLAAEMLRELRRDRDVQNLRDDFAKTALAGLLPLLAQNAIPGRMPWEGREMYVAFAAYDVADAMLTARHDVADVAARKVRP